MTVKIPLEDYIAPKLEAILNKRIDKFQNNALKQELTKDIMDLIMDVVSKTPERTASEEVDHVVDFLKESTTGQSQEKFAEILDHIFSTKS